MSDRNVYIIADRDQSDIAEAFRVIRNAIQAAQRDAGVKTVLFVGVCQAEGMLMTAVNTAASLAYAGSRVVVVDCDFQNPALNDVFGLKNVGISDVIAKGLNLQAVIQSTSISSLKVLTSGSVPVTRPLEILSNEKLKDMIEQLKTHTDYIIITGTPLMTKRKENILVTDACLLASKADGVVLVIDRGMVLVKSAKKAKELIQGARGKIIGSILTGVQDDEELVYFAAN